MVDTVTGSIYKGNYSEGIRKGMGIILCMEEGSKKFDVYRGEFNDKPNGKGIYYYHSIGLIVEGSFKDGEIDSANGLFRIRYSNGDVYEGSLLNKKKHGKGKLYYTNGDFYDGEWHRDKREGKGKFYIKIEEMMIDGTFVNDEVVNGKMLCRHGTVFSAIDDETNPGRFEKGKLEGKVRIDYANGNFYVGYFHEGKRSGKGKMIFTDIIAVPDPDDDDITGM